jgi:hypothetical protein
LPVFALRSFQAVEDGVILDFVPYVPCAREGVSGRGRKRREGKKPLFIPMRVRDNVDKPVTSANRSAIRVEVRKNTKMLVTNVAVVP